MSKFLSDDWMRENGFLEESESTPDRFHGATVADLDLPAPVTCSETTSCAEAVELLHNHGFEFMPLMTADGKVKETAQLCGRVLRGSDWTDSFSSPPSLLLLLFLLLVHCGAPAQPRVLGSCPL